MRAQPVAHTMGPPQPYPYQHVVYQHGLPQHQQPPVYVASHPQMHPQMQPAGGAITMAGGPHRPFEIPQPQPVRYQQQQVQKQPERQVLAPERIVSMAGGTEGRSGGVGDDEFVRLLDSLEKRVDLMAQMQSTRNEVEQRGRQLEDYRYSMDMRERSGQPVDIAQIKQENAYLWQTVDEQNETINRMAEENAFLAAQLHSLGISPRAGGADELREQLQTLLDKARMVDEEGQQLRELLENEQRERERMEYAFMVEREQLQAEISSLLMDGNSGSHAGSRVASKPPSRISSPRGYRLVGDHDAMSALSGNRPRSPGNRPRSPGNRPRSPASPTRNTFDRMAMTQPAQIGNFGVGLHNIQSTPTSLLQPISQNGISMAYPFSKQTCGVNILLSDDGYTAHRQRGCRQSVAIGDGPLARQQFGWYFEVEITQTMEGWVGGLGIGVSTTGPDQLRRVPDKAWRLPHTYVVGYWGCVFLDGQERRTKWRVDNLQVGTKVGFLVDATGTIRVFAAGEMVVMVKGALIEQIGTGSDLFAVVDVFASTQTVRLIPSAEAPAKPWQEAPDAEVSISDPAVPGTMGD